jgi:hypothetical protein
MPSMLHSLLRRKEAIMYTRTIVGSMAVCPDDDSGRWYTTRQYEWNQKSGPN